MNRKTVRKLFFVWEFEKEERWLNEMAAQGWVLESVGFCTYRFVECQPGEYIIRLEMRGHDSGYLDFLSEMGVEYIGRCFQWIFLKKPAADGPFDLFSDIDSRASHLRRPPNWQHRCYRYRRKLPLYSRSRIYDYYGKY